MGTERDTTANTGLVRRAGSTLSAAVSPDTPPRERRTAMLKTVGVTSVTMASGVAGIDLLAHYPSALSVLSSPLAQGVEWGGGSSLVVGGFVAGMTIAMSSSRQRNSDRVGLGRFFHRAGAVTTIGAATLGVAAAAVAAGGAGHLLPDASSVAAGLAVSASAFGGMSGAGHIMSRAVTPRQHKPRAQLGE